MGIPAPPDVLVGLPAAISEPYVMQRYPSDSGYASLAVHAFDPYPTGRNVQHVIDGGGRPQIVTNFHLHRHPDLPAMPDGPPTPQTQAFWRYRILAAHQGSFTAESATQPTPAPTSSGCWKQRHPAPADQGSPRR